MFPGVIPQAEEALVQQGIPSLRAEMDKAGIDTPRRKAAFFATLRHESRFRFDIPQENATARYKGRGYIQLTGLANYTECGKYLGIDLVGHPDLALSLEWSAKIAIWYWNVARHCSLHADNLQMGLVNKDIGYPLSLPGKDGKTNDQHRCESFAEALKYLTGTVPLGITCTRS